MREAFLNSLYVARASSALFAALIAVPLAYFTVRFRFRGAILIQTLGVLPLIMPPFVGAVAMQLIFGRSGSVNLLLDEWFGITHADHGRPERRHLRRVDPLLPVHPDEPDGRAAQHRRRDGGGGAEPRRPRLAAVLARDLSAARCRASSPARRWSSSRSSTTSARRWCSGTTNLLAPQAYLRITQVGLEDPLGYVISVIMIAFSILALWLSARVLQGQGLRDAAEGRRRHRSAAS